MTDDDKEALEAAILDAAIYGTGLWLDMAAGKDEVKDLNDAKLEARRKAFESQKP